MIYIAGPFFNEEERTNLEEMIKYVKSLFPNEELFIPMEHFVPNSENLPNHIWSKEVYKMDINALDSCRMVCALYLGHYSDTGTAFEIGYAVAKGIPVLTYIPKSKQDLPMSLVVTSSTTETNWSVININQK